jgi:hypothetical protein
MQKRKKIIIEGAANRKKLLDLLVMDKICNLFIALWEYFNILTSFNINSRENHVEKG